MVVFQFALSMALLSGSWIVYKQVDHLRGIDPGFSTDQVLVVERPGVIDDVPQYVAQRTAFFEQVRSLSAVSVAANSTMVPGNGYNMTTSARPESAPNSESFGVSAFWIGNQFLDTYGMTLLAGRELDMESESDRDAGMLVNRTAMLAFGFENPEDALGETVMVGDNSPTEILGVLNDFNWMSAKESASPVLIYSTRGGTFFSLKIAAGNISKTVKDIESLFHQSFPGNSYEYFFADDRFNELYQSEERLMSLVSVFAVFALLVAALGLLGLAALTAAQRRKEISVRKVLGAGHATVARLLTGHFDVLVGIATIIAFPIVWFVGDRWLDNFASRTAMTVDIFLLPAVIVLAVSLVASGYHVWRLATANPIDGIRAS
jgi:putative ABC transport system permease protein